MRQCAYLCAGFVASGAVQAGPIAIDSNSTPNWAADVTTATGSNLILAGSANGVLSGNVSGAGSLTMAGSAEWILTGDNTYSGGTKLQSGTLAPGSNTALGTGTLMLNGGTLRPVGARTLANTVSLRADTTIGGSDALALGALTLNGFASLDITNTSAGGVTITGPVTQSQLSILIKQGEGELRLNGAGSYTGGTFVEAGTVRIANTTGSALGTGAVTVGPDGVLAGGGRFTGPLALDGTLAPGDSVGAMRSGSQTWNGGAGLIWEIDAATGVAGGTTGWDLIAIDGGLSLTASALDPFEIRLASLTTANSPGWLGDFDASGSYSFTFLTTTAGVYGFDASAFVLDTTAFLNAPSGVWSVSNHGDHLSLDYTGGTNVVPDGASTALLVGLGCGGLFLLGRARRLGLRRALALALGLGVCSTRADVTFDSALGDVASSFDTTGNNLTLLGIASASFQGNIGGSGSLTKSGAGTWRLAGNNTYTGGTWVNEGVLSLETASSASVHAIGGGSLVIGSDGKVVLIGTGDDLFGWSTDVALSGSLDLHGRNESFDELMGPGLIMNSVSGTSVTLTLGQDNGSSTFGGSLQNGNGVISLAKIGAGRIALSGTNTHSGGTRLDAGTLAILADGALGTGTLVLNGGTFEPVGARTIANGVSLVGSSTIGGVDAVTFTGAFVLNGFKSLTISNTASGGVTINGPVTQSRPSIFIKQGDGELQLNGAGTYTGGALIGGGTVRINNASGSAFGSGAVTVAAGATLTGGGSFTGPLVLDGLISPGNFTGTLTSGSETWNGGAGLVWKINAVGGTAGADPGWSLLAINGALTLNATADDPFNVYLVSLTGENVAGSVSDFDRFTSYSFVFATTEGVTGFDPNAFNVVTDGFTNLFSGGSWSVVQTGIGLNALSLQYAGAAIPEPMSCALWAGALALVLAIWRRRDA